MAKAASFGSQLQYDTGGAVFVAIPSLVSVSGPSLGMETVDVTTHDSTGGWREHLTTVKDGGTVTAVFLYDPDDTHHAAMQTNFAAGTETTFKEVLTTANSAEIDYNGFVTGYEVEPGAIDGRLELTMTIQVTGAVTITAAP